MSYRQSGSEGFGVFGDIKQGIVPPPSRRGIPRDPVPSFSKTASRHPSEPLLLKHPRIPEPLHGLNPRTIKGRKWWDIQRAEAYLRHENHCMACGVASVHAVGSKRLEAHECYEIDYERGTSTFLRVVALCNYCHSYIHDGRLASCCLQNPSLMNKYIKILAYGNRVLSRAGSPFRKTCFPEKIPQEDKVTWQEWRLVFEGKEYFSLYKDRQEKRAFYKEVVPSPEAIMQLKSRAASLGLA